MRVCRVFPQFAFGFPTLHAYPPPPPEPLREPPPRPRIPRPSPLPAPIPRRSRSPSWRLLHDCLCIPDYHIMKAFYDARRQAAEKELRPAVAAAPPWSENPVTVGLLLTLVPPLGVTLLWASRRFSRAGKIGVTAYAAAVSIAIVAVVAWSLA
jgi:hypothetical protein